MQELTRILQDATTSIAPEYFLLPVEGGVPVYRERVYCYELYHQMRCRWPDPCRFILNGEVDKNGHAVLAGRGVRGEKPDLLVHFPGEMARNHAIIEVKGPKLSVSGIRKDLTTLSSFSHRAGYGRAIYLVYGASAGRVVGQVGRIADLMQYVTKIELWVHEGVGAPAFQVCTILGSA